jgi:hypothetical protein
MVYRDVMGLAPGLVERFARAADVIREPAIELVNAWIRGLDTRAVLAAARR